MSLLGQVVHFAFALIHLCPLLFEFHSTEFRSLVKNYYNYMPAKKQVEIFVFTKNALKILHFCHFFSASLVIFNAFMLNLAIFTKNAFFIVFL